jgi:hypothetical protein
LPGKTSRSILSVRCAGACRTRKARHWIAGFEILNAQGSDIEHWEAALQVMDEQVPPG